jgi:CRISPR system Cascade subunit CasA
VNLITDPWIPVRMRSGVRRLIRPAELADPVDPPVELDAERPDFNGALAQFLIGLIQYAAAPESEDDWAHWLRHPPTIGELDGALAQLASAFDMEGDKPFMQDAGLDPAVLEARSINALLLETPGDNALVNNTDLFIKRSDVPGLSAELAALSLLTLQTNAPSGGQGHRTSLRGGGPLTTLIWPEMLTHPTVSGQANIPATLWQKVWFNVQPDLSQPPQDHSIALPWIAPCLTSEGGRTVREASARIPSKREHWGLCTFATPRRIRLLWNDDAQPRYCVGFVTQNYGANYPSDFFQHPASPYYRTKDGNWLPLHIRASGFGYRDYTSLCVGPVANDEDRRVAEIVTYAVTSPQRRAALCGTSALWAFGFAMDNMKVLAWHEAHYPIFVELDHDARKILSNEAGKLVAAADETGKLLTQSIRKLGGDADLAVRELRSASEPTFYALLESCCNDSSAEQRLSGRESWRKRLFGIALALFERFVERDIDGQSRLNAIRKAAQEQRSLVRKLGAALDAALELKRARATDEETA